MTSLATELQDQAIKPNYKAIKPSYTATRPSHETNVSQTPEETQANGQASNNSASTSSLYDPDSTKSSWEPQKELSTFLEKQFRRKLTYDQVCEILDNYSVLKRNRALYTIPSLQEIKFQQRKLNA